MKRFTLQTSTKRVLYVIAGVLVIVVALGLGKLWYLNKTGNFYAGEIVSANSDQIVVRGRNNNERVVHIDSITRIKGWRLSKESPFEVGQRVIIVGTSNNEDFISAKLIHVVKK